MSENSLKARYDALKPQRDPYLRRGRDLAALTIPALMPPDGQHFTMQLPETYQGFAARCVTNLSSRLLMAMYPAGMSSFRLQIPPDVLMKAGRQTADAELDRNLALTEKSINSEIEAASWRSPTDLAMQYLIVVGNVLEQMLPDNTIRLFRLDQYCAVRDPMGQLIELVIEEAMHPQSVPEQLRGLLGERSDPNAVVALYTQCKLKDGKWHVSQEFEGSPVPNSAGTYARDELPFQAHRWKFVVGESYGRGKCEEHWGDLRSLEGLSKAMAEGAAMASRNITMIRPGANGGVNLKRRMDKARNGETVVGDAEDVGMLQFQNIGGLQVTQAQLAELKKELAGAFLLTSSVQRNGERVTAYELRLMVEELEGVLGGVYSMLAQQMQAPRISRLILQMQKTEKLPVWPKGVIRPQILTGLEALAREAEVQRVVSAMQILTGVPDDVKVDYVKWSELLAKAMNGLSLPDVVWSEAEATQRRAQRMQAQALQDVASTMGKSMAAPAAQ